LLAAVDATAFDPTDVDCDGVLQLTLRLHEKLRERITTACAESSAAQLSAVVADGPGDTMFAIDAVGESALIELLDAEAASVGGIVLVAEGIDTGAVCLPRGSSETQARWRMICDPIDGTRCLMYQKRSAWILTGVAPNRGSQSRLSDVVCAVQTELPLQKQHLSDQLWATRGGGARARRFDRLRGQNSPLVLRPSSATSIVQGYAMISRLFPGARDELARIDDELMLRVLGTPPPGKALCFEEQYPSSGGQLYELMAGHDRFNADLRPLLTPTLLARGLSPSVCCHPYDICTALIATELGVELTNPDGTALDAPMDLGSDVAWVGYANAAIRRQIEPTLHAILRERGWLS